MSEIKLTKRFPESRPEDITEAYMRGYEAGLNFRERTCHQVNIGGYSFRFECSACGYVAIVHNCTVRLDELPNYCPKCGARVEVEK